MLMRGKLGWNGLMFEAAYFTFAIVGAVGAGTLAGVGAGAIALFFF